MQSASYDAKVESHVNVWLLLIYFQSNLPVHSPSYILVSLWTFLSKIYQSLLLIYTRFLVNLSRILCWFLVRDALILLTICRPKLLIWSGRPSIWIWKSLEFRLSDQTRPSLLNWKISPSDQTFCKYRKTIIILTQLVVDQFPIHFWFE